MKRGVFGRLSLGLGILLQVLVISSASARHRNPQNETSSSPRDDAPECLGHDGQELANNNAEVLKWKTSTPNNYLNRAHVSGTVIAVYPDQTGHAHFGIRLGGSDLAYDGNSGNSSDTLEVIYDLGFGPIPDVHEGDSIEACGDYITAYSQSGHYPPSPDGAIIHWIHKSDKPAKHPDGFLVINGDVCGQELPNH